MSGLITSGLTWEFRAFGIVPPNVPQEAVIGSILSNVSICTAILPFVRGQNVLTHELTPEQVQERINREMERLQKGKH